MNIILIDALIGNDYTICLADALVRQGMRVILITPSNRDIKLKSGFRINKWMPSKDTSDSILSKLIEYPIFIFKTISLILKQRNSIIHFQFFRFKIDIFFILFLRLLGIKIVYTAHNIFPHERKKSDLWLNYILYKVSGRIIIHSEIIKRKLLSNFKIDPEKTAVVPHGNFDIYKPFDLPTQTDARKYFNLTISNKVLLFFGYIKEYKGLDLLLNAYKLLAEKEPELRLLIAGFPATRAIWENYLKIIENITDKSKIITRPDFIPAEEVALYFSAADYVVLPYKRIDHSGIIHLAYSFNKPVIATKVGDFEEHIENEKSGYLVNSQNIEDLASTIAKALKNYSNLAEMQKYIVEMNKSRYSWEEAAKKTVEVYESF